MADWLAKHALGLVMLSLTIGLAPAVSSADDALTAEQDAAVREIIHDYLLSNPEVLVEALRVYERRQKDQVAARQREAILANLEGLADDPLAPVLGNPEGDVLVVEFFDYRCPYCRKVTADLMDAVEKDGGIRLVFKEFPILGPDSLVAARAALAAAEQDRYRDFHLALMTTPGKLDEASILALASDLGLDVGRLRKDMSSERVERQIRDNHRLGQALQINGTPAFVVGKEIVPGAVPMQQLLELVRRERAKTG